MQHQRQARVAGEIQAPLVPPVSHTGADAILAAVAAGLAATAWVGARAAGIVLEVRSGSGTSDVNVVSVVVATLVVSIVGAALLRMLERRTAQALQIWTMMAAVVWAASSLGPLSATRLPAGLVLAGLHLLVGAVVIAGLRRVHAPDPNAVRDDA